MSNPHLYLWNGDFPLSEVEKALDAGRLEIRAGGPEKWYTVRRNGATRRWKTQPDRFRIPVKYGFYGYEALESPHLDHFRIKDIS